MKRTTTLLLLLLAGCGQNSDHPAPPDHCDFVGETGICVAFDAGLTFHPDLWGRDVVEPAYVDTRQCSTDFLSDPSVLEITGGVVRFVAVPFVVDGEERHGWTDYGTGQITVVFNDETSRLDRNGRRILTEILQHEYVHYLLLRSRRNPDHGNPLFSACDPLQSK